MSPRDNFMFVLSAALIFIGAMFLMKVAGDNEMSSCLSVLAIIMATCSLIWAFLTLTGMI
jgi:hypothetical protein